MEKHSNALIVFVKNPVEGKVKTRLAADIGGKKALMIYQELIRITGKAVEKLTGTDVYLFYSDSVPGHDIIKVPGKTEQPAQAARVEVQHGRDLGLRMLNAFRYVKNQTQTGMNQQGYHPGHNPAHEAHHQPHQHARRQTGQNLQHQPHQHAGRHANPSPEYNRGQYAGRHTGPSTGHHPTHNAAYHIRPGPGYHPAHEAGHFAGHSPGQIPAHQKICIIGTDCPELTTELLYQAFYELEAHDLVAGPAADGGYYLLGMKEIHPVLFAGKQWGSSSVLEATLHDAGQAGLSVALLPELRDLDDMTDLAYFPSLEKLLWQSKPAGS